MDEKHQKLISLIYLSAHFFMIGVLYALAPLSENSDIVYFIVLAIFIIGFFGPGILNLLHK